MAYSHKMSAIVCAFSFSILTTVAEAAGPTQLSTVFVPESGAPITLTRQLSTLQDHLAEMEFANSSGRDVKAVKLAWISLAPAQCSESALAPITGPERTYALDLPAGKTATLKNAGLSPADLLRWAQPAGAHMIQTQVALTEVDFADGGVWRSARSINEPFSTDELTAASQSCRDGRVTEAARRPIGSENRAAAGSPAASPNIVGCYWKCVDSTSIKAFCAASSGGCNLTNCSNLQLCAYQNCVQICVE